MKKKEFLASDVSKITGVERRTLQTWVDGGFLSPSLEKGEGPGTRNRWSADDLIAIKLFEYLLTQGFSREAAARIVAKNHRMYDVGLDGKITEYLDSRDLAFCFASDTIGIPSYAIHVRGGSQETSLFLTTLGKAPASILAVLEFLKIDDLDALIVVKIDHVIAAVFTELA